MFMTPRREVSFIDGEIIRIMKSLSLLTFFFTVAVLFPTAFSGGIIATPLCVELGETGGSIEGVAADDFFGQSTAINAAGDVVAIGAPFSDANGGSSGQVRVFEYDEGIWTQKGGNLDGGSAGDTAGNSVALNAQGDVIAVGATGSDPNGASSGSVRIFELIGAVWVQKGAAIDGVIAGDEAGISVSSDASGDVIAVGARFHGGGNVRVFAYSGGNWVQQGSDLDSEGSNDQYGYSVSLSSTGDILAIGGHGNAGNGPNSGHVRVFERILGSWVQKGTDIDGLSSSDRFGYSVSLSSAGGVVAVGAPARNSGYARILSFSGGDWVQKGSAISGENSGDWSGISVAIDAAGDTVAIGAHRNDNVNGGENSGHTRVFDWNGVEWTQRGVDIDGEAENEGSGISVAMNSAGDVVVVGANRGGSSGEGEARVYCV